jgi:predicted membrane channel-forming protein YqfA (hemolysin III family)
MRLKETLSSRIGVAGELLEFFWGSKWWWLTPMIFVLLVFAGLVIFAQGSAVAPFIYTLF